MSTVHGSGTAEALTFNKNYISKSDKMVAYYAFQRKPVKPQQKPFFCLTCQYKMPTYQTKQEQEKRKRNIYNECPITQCDYDLSLLRLIKPFTNYNLSSDGIATQTKGLVLQRTFSKQGSIFHTNSMRSHYSLKCSSFVTVKYHYFSLLIPQQHFSHLSMRLRALLQQKLVLAFATIHKQPYPRPHFCGISSPVSFPPLVLCSPLSLMYWANRCGYHGCLFDHCQTLYTIM
jgi:hypothetical protein